MKRKRNEEPLDALVFESRKRTKATKPGEVPGAPPAPGVSVFQFAETVEDAAWKSERERNLLQERITALAKNAPTEGSPIAVSPLAENVTMKSPPLASAVYSPPLSPVTAPSEHARARQYSIVEHKEEAPPSRRYGAAPPKVISAAAAAAASKFAMYDVVPSSEAQEKGVASGATASGSSAVPDEEMDAFLPLLRDYLKLSDVELATPAQTVTSPPALSRRIAKEESSTRIGEEDEDDYVWDVFYYRPTLSEWNTVAGGNVGSLTGLPPSVNDPDDSDSESEPEDEDDEDSNAEDYYKNDYPEEEDDLSDSDEFHEDSDYDDFLKDELDEEEHDWR